jgi:hypothetical protein
MKWFIASDTINPQRFNEGWCKVFHIVCNVLTLLFTYDVTDIIKWKNLFGVLIALGNLTTVAAQTNPKGLRKQRSLMRLLLSKPKAIEQARSNYF